MARPSRLLLSALIIVLIGCAACRAPGDGRGSDRGPLKIAVIPMGTTHEFWKSVHAGALTAAREFGVEIIWKGRLILMRVKEGVEGTTKREEGFLSTLRAEFPAIVVLSDNQYAGTSTEMAYQTMENLLSRFTAVDAVFTPNESTTFGALRALQDHGLAGKVIHVGFDASDKLIKALEKGEIRGLVLQDPFAMGYLSLKTAVAHLRGEPYEKTVATALVLATTENMNEPQVRRLLRPDLSILRD
ncbi:MAG TPA: substrate-binding domain-containing protein [Candidatus Latescibacteria bacterium]|nr:substrate-binding domain-containing protein [Candidatus Latescibacterota bacterium]